jgi:hypothetical protein
LSVGAIKCNVQAYNVSAAAPIYKGAIILLTVDGFETTVNLCDAIDAILPDLNDCAFGKGDFTGQESVTVPTSMSLDIRVKVF